MTYSRVKRVICLLLSILILVAIPLTAFADGGNANTGPTWKPIVPGKGGSSTGDVTMTYGYRVSLSTAGTFSEDGIGKLDGQYTRADLDAQYSAIVDTATQRWYCSDGMGLNFAEPYRGQPLTGMKALASGTECTFSQTGYIKKIRGSGAISNGTQNILGYMIYNTPEGYGDRPADVLYNDQLHELVVNGRSQYSDSSAWLEAIRGTAGITSQQNIELMEGVLFTDYAALPASIDNFTWASNVFKSGNDNAAQLVNWSYLGYLSTLIQLTWYAQDIQDTNTYNAFAELISNWAASGWKAESMPVILIEATVCVAYAGAADMWENPGGFVMATLPACLALTYNGSPVYGERLTSKWDNQSFRTDDVLSVILSNAYATGSWRIMNRVCGKLWNGGTVTDSGDVVRAATKMLPAKATDRNEIYGYNFFFTYYVDNPGDGSNTTEIKADSKGSFTWDLDPKGVYDVSPDKEINKSSTITNLNISQSGYNNNNYSDWERYVGLYGNDCNRIRINVYRISEALPDDKAATIYTRDQVKAKGKPVTEAVDRVTLGNGYITGWPSGSKITQLKSGEISQELSNADFLKILKEATGLSYSETIAGPIEDNGIRVTYAVYVDYNVGY